MAAGHEITDGMGVIHVSIVIRVIIVINVIIVIKAINVRPSPRFPLFASSRAAAPSPSTVVSLRGCCHSFPFCIAAAFQVAIFTPDFDCFQAKSGRFEPECGHFGAKGGQPGVEGGWLEAEGDHFGAEGGWFGAEGVVGMGARHGRPGSFRSSFAQHPPRFPLSPMAKNKPYGEVPLLRPSVRLSLRFHEILFAKRRISDYHFTKIFFTVPSGIRTMFTLPLMTLSLCTPEVE